MVLRFDREQEGRGRANAGLSGAGSMKKRSLGTVGCLALVVVCAIGVTIQLVREGIQQRGENDAAAKSIAALTKQLESGDASGAVDALMLVVKQHPKASQIEEYDSLLALLERFPAPALDSAVKAAPAKIGHGGKVAFALLARVAIIRKWPTSAEALAARTELMSPALLGDVIAIPDVYDLILKALAGVEDPAFFDELRSYATRADPTAAVSPETDAAMGRKQVASEVLGTMGPKGWKVLADEVPVALAADAEPTFALMGLERAQAGIVAFIQPYLAAAEKGEVRKRYATILGGVARSSDHPDHEAAGKVLRGAVRDPWIAIASLDFYLAEGDESTVPYLSAALDQVGTVDDASRMLNCGSEQLEQAAAAWGRAHGYEIKTKPGSKSGSWGRGN